jgi:hypothetical protein
MTKTESTVVAGQDQALSTICFQKRHPTEEAGSKCCLCKGYEETTDHLTIEYPILTNN